MRNHAINYIRIQNGRKQNVHLLVSLFALAILLPLLARAQDDGEKKDKDVGVKCPAGIPGSSPDMRRRTTGRSSQALRSIPSYLSYNWGLNDQGENESVFRRLVFSSLLYPAAPSVDLTHGLTEVFRLWPDQSEGCHSGAGKGRFYSRF